MARKRGQQVDPFNAGDPIMPWDRDAEYVPVEREAQGRSTGTDDSRAVFDEHDQCWLNEDAGKHTGAPTSSFGKPGAKPGTAASKPKASWTPKATKSAATRGKKPTKKPASKTAKSAAAILEEERARSRRRSRRGMTAVKIIVILALLGFLAPIGQCAASLSAPHLSIATSDSDESTAPTGSDTSASNPAELMEDQQLQEITNRLSSVQDDASLVQRAGAKLDQDFQMYTDGITMQQAGVDPTELARWVLTSATYDPSTSNSYAYEDGGNEYEGRVYLDVSTANTVDIPYDLGTFVHRDLLGYQPLPADGLTADQKAQVATKAEEIKAKGNTSDSSLSFDFEGTWDPASQKITTTMDEDEWSEQVLELFGIYED